jgi:putative phosphoribosyl transferase
MWTSGGAHAVKFHFNDRYDAGRQLAERLQIYAHHQNTMVIGLPRGGVPVAWEVSKYLGLPLGVLLAKKFGLPSHPEFALGAVAGHDAVSLNFEGADAFRVPRELLYDLACRSRIELSRRQQMYYALCPEPQVKDQIVLLVDDGIATGSTILAAEDAVRKGGAARVVLAAPVIAGEAFDRLQAMGEEVVAVIAPTEFHHIGEWYTDFRRPTDEDALQLLAEGRRAV